MQDGVELTCQELVAVVTRYLEGAMPEHERELFEAHVGQCRGCRAYVAQMRTTIRLAGTLTEDAIDARMRGRLLAAFRGWRGPNGALP